MICWARERTTCYFAIAIFLTLYSSTCDGFIHRHHHPVRHGAAFAKTRTRLFESSSNGAISSEEVRSRLQQQMERLRAKDRQSRALKPEDLKIIFEDEHIIVVDKPSGVICVSNDNDVPSIAKTVFEHCRPVDLTHPDQMVVHRLGSDTSGMIVLAKTMEAVRGMNALFRTRKITRQYEALVCGHVPKKEGLISLPLMRDYEHPPYMRISTDEHQRQLLSLDAEVVGRKLLEAPKAAMTHYQVIAKESIGGDESAPVTRLMLTSITGRTHQLNVHCAAIGHPIVRDSVYGYQGEAAAHGGLDQASLPDDSASEALQGKIADAAKDLTMCIHAKLIRFRHPITKESVEYSSAAPF